MQSLLVVGAVALLPVLVVWAGDQIQAMAGAPMRLAASQVAAAVVTMDDPERIRGVARQMNARVVVLDASGALVHDIDESERGLFGRTTDLLYGDEEPPTLEGFNASRPPLGALPFLSNPPVTHPEVRCLPNDALTLLVCEAAMRAPRGERVLVQLHSRQAVLALYEHRWRVLRIGLLVAFFGALLGGFMALRWSSITTLRNGALERARQPLRAEPFRLERRDELGDLARAFDTLLEAVQQQSAAREAFVADLAHELKNPVAAISAAAEALDRRDVSPERAARLARVLSHSSERLQRVLAELLELSRAEAGLPGDVREVFALDEVVLGVCRSVQEHPDHGHLRVEVQVQPGLVDGVRDRLEDAVRNLVANAASFGRNSITVSLVPDEGTLCLRVSDDGPGIAEEHLERVFDRFFTTRSEATGTGIGLALVKAVVEAHGGRIRAGRGEAGGALFEVHLPQARV